MNLMKLKNLFAVTLICLGFAGAVYGQGQVVSRAYEVSLDNFTAPTTANSGVSFKQCDDCEREIIRVTAGTRYSVNGKSVRLEDFRKAVGSARDAGDKTVTVLHHLESDTVEALDAWI